MQYQAYKLFFPLIPVVPINSTLANLSAETSAYLPVTSSAYLNALIILAAFIILAQVADFVFKKIFTRIVWIENPVIKLVALDQLNEGIAREFAKAEIEIPFPTQAVYLRK